MSITVYSANYGGKDTLMDPYINSSWSKDLKFVYFTDQEFDSDVWEFVVEKKHGDANRIAKWYKVNSHEVFPGEITLWMDANIRLIGDPTDWVDGWENLMLKRHPKRKDVYEEAAFCIKAGIGVKEDIEVQIASYKMNEYPAWSGLYKGGVLFRKPTDAITKFNKAWWEQIKRYSARDQLSLAYVLYQQQLVFNIYPKSRHYFSSNVRHLYGGTKEIE